MRWLRQGCRGRRCPLKARRPAMPLCDVEVTFPDLILRVSDEEDGRTIEGVVLPWDRPTYVSKPMPGYEVYKRGALDTSTGRDALELIRSNLYTGLSIGASSIPARTTIRRAAGGKTVIERSEVKLDHIALVRTPAFDDARVTVLRSEDLMFADPVAEAKARQRRRLRELADLRP